MAGKLSRQRNIRRHMLVKIAQARVSGKPQPSQTELADAVGIDRKLAFHHCSRLLAAQLILVTPGSRSVGYRLSAYCTIERGVLRVVAEDNVCVLIPIPERKF